MGFCPGSDSVVSPVVKYILLIGTFLHWACGATMVGIGIWAFVEKNKYFYQPIEDIYDVIFDLSIVLIVVGGVMFIITMCGFVGALRENTCLLKFFYIALTIIFLAEIVGGALAFIFKDKAVEELKRVLKMVYVDSYQDDEESVMDYFQENFECCGIRGYDDWNSNMYYNCTSGNVSPLKCAVPYSCCKDPDEFTPGLVNILCGAETLGNSTVRSKIWTTGCVDKVLDIAQQNLPIIGAVAIGIAVPQLLGIFLGRMFAGQVEHQWARYKEQQDRGYPSRERDYRRRY